MTKEDILDLIKNDQWMMDILRAARSLYLPDWMIGAGFVRNKVWDHLHGYQNKEVPTADIDLIYFDSNNLSEEQEKEYDVQLGKMIPVKWSSKNQARMHEKHGRKEAYKNTEEALSEWVETATCVAIRLEEDDTLSLFAPHGTEDLTNLIVRPSPTFINDIDIFWERVKNKDWEKKWPKLEVITKW